MTWPDHKKAALSLTFDDGTPGQYEFALPELNKRLLKGTFFLVSDPANTPRQYDTEFRTEIWQDAVDCGHEIGGHSATHLNIADMKADLPRAGHDILTGKRDIEDRLGIKLVSYAFPFEFEEGLQCYVRPLFKQARSVGRPKIITNYEDFYRIPSLRCKGNTDLRGILDELVASGGWLTLMFHGIGHPENFDNIPVPQFKAMLDEIQRRQVWIAPFGTVAEFVRNPNVRPQLR